MGFRRFGGREQDTGPKPVSVGDELSVNIEAVAAKGDGIAKKEGFVIFVPGVRVGDKIKIKVTEVKSRCAIAQVLGPGEETPSSAPAAEAQEAAKEEAPAAPAEEPAKEEKASE